MKKLLSVFLCAFVAYTSKAQTDLYVSSKDTPVDGIGMSNSEIISFTAYNYGWNYEPIGTVIDIAYSINGGAFVNEQVTLVSDFYAYDYMSFNFSTPADFSTPGSYTLTLVITSPNDYYHANDTSLYTITHYSGPSITSTYPTFVTKRQNDYVDIYGIGTFFADGINDIFLTNGSDTIWSNNTTVYGNDYLYTYFDVACSKPVGIYSLYVNTLTNGILSLPNSIEVKSPYDITVYSNNPNCHGDTNGYIEIYPYNVNQNDMIYWGTGQDTGVYYLNNLGAGEYIFHILDTTANGAGCEVSDTITFVDPAPLTGTIDKIDANCGSMDGIMWATASGGGGNYDFMWSWNEAGGDTLSGMEAGYYEVYIDDAFGCSISLGIDLYEQLTIQVGTASTLCGVNDGTATATILNGTAPFTIQWSNGDFGNGADSLAPGSYNVIATDNSGCSGSAMFTIVGADGPQITAVNVTPPSCGSNPNGAIDITVSGGSAPYVYLWSNGATTQDISGLTPGTYQVFIEDANGCSFGQCVQVSDGQQFGFDYVYSYTPSFCGATDGSIEATTMYGVEPIDIQWSANAGGQTGGYPTNLAQGIYYAIATDATGCRDSVAVVVNDNNSPYWNWVSDVQGNCGSSNAGMDIFAGGGNGGPYDITWDGTLNQEDLYNVEVGYHTVHITDALGCAADYFVYFYGDSPGIQDICLVSVDSTSGYNTVAWEKAAVTNIDHYNIYRETCVSNGFEFVGSVPYDSLSLFVDYGANAAVQSWKYRMTQVDICGTESEVSPIHKTIHLDVDRTLGQAIDLAWDEYIGFAYTEHIIWRYHSSTGWVSIDTVPNTQFTYSDLTPPAQDSVEYMIEVVAPYTCNSTRAISQNTARSNRQTVAAPFGNDVEELAYGTLNVFPNPNEGNFNISFTSAVSQTMQITVIDLSGKVVYTHQITSIAGQNNLVMNLDQVNTGIYQIMVGNTERMFTSRVIVE